MPKSRPICATLAGAALSLCLCSAAALAAGPATVTVRVEGLTETKLPATVVTTNASPVINDENPAHACSGTSALGALQVATDGDWSGPWEGGQYFIDTILGETHLFQEGVRSYYWSFWVNDKYAPLGACEIPLEQNGERVLFFPECDEACPQGPAPTPLEIETGAAANVGEPLQAIVKQYNMNGEASPAVGAQLEWSGGSTTSDAQGDATLSFPAAGVYSIHVTGSTAGPPAVRTEASVCVHDGNDGTCGTSAPSQTPHGAVGVEGFTESHAAPYRGPFALVPHMSSVVDGHVYSRTDAPRQLIGTILAHSAVSSVSLELRRRRRGRCYAYAGSSGRFYRTRCGSGGFFKVSTSAAFSYLLPAALAPGQYILDIAAEDVVGNHTTPARGTSRVVFYVR
jgi:hypothetical protein